MVFLRKIPETEGRTVSKDPETRQTFFKESLSPLTDDLPGQRNACGDLVVTQTLSRHQNDFCADNGEVR